MVTVVTEPLDHRHWCWSPQGWRIEPGLQLSSYCQSIPLSSPPHFQDSNKGRDKWNSRSLSFRPTWTLKYSHQDLGPKSLYSIGGFYRVSSKFKKPILASVGQRKRDKCQKPLNHLIVSINLLQIKVSYRLKCKGESQPGIKSRSVQ